MTEIPADFYDEENVTLEFMENNMRAIEQNIKIGIALIAVALGRIKRESLFLQVAPNWKAYLLQERTDMSYQKAVKLSAAGEKFWEYRQELQGNGIRISQHLSKMALIDNQVADYDPMFWERFKTLSVNGLKDYIQRKRDDINVYHGKCNDESMTRLVTVNGSFIAIGGQKLRGLNLNEAREQMASGKRLVALWVDDSDVTARRVRRQLDRAGING
jgi:hypothetical protein